MAKQISVQVAQNAVKKAEMMERIKELLQNADKMLVIVGYSDKSERPGLALGYCQTGFQYEYEINGFTQEFLGSLAEGEFDKDENCPT